ncbi:MAG: GIY-YIG nuclease family protein [Limisphaerales bacterium]
MNEARVQIKEIESAKFVNAIWNENGREKITFSTKPPEEAGVYVIYEKGKNKPFYVGETRNLFRRLKMLFRCNSKQNPHPCQLNFATAIGKKIDGVKPKEFCARMKVKFLSTAKLVGRIEIERELQKKYGTNCDSFYKRFAE